ncbi:MAG: putative bifunctional diguanylate cyclase/phosphodiesterase [Leptospirales bacterium]
MTGNYSSSLVILSVIIAILAAYSTFALASRITDTTGKTKLLWLWGGACSMGLGIWSMHFIGMLALRLPVPVSYSVWITLLSLLIAVVVSGFALHIVSRSRLGTKKLIMGSSVMGFGVAGMHYTGMLAMSMGLSIRYNPLLFTASILIAIVASGAALRIVFILRQGKTDNLQRKRLLSAVMMGVAIAGMHYTGMAAAIFPSGMKGTHGQFFDNTWLSVTIGLATFGILTVTLILSLVDSHLASRTAGLLGSLKSANEELHYLALHDGLTKLPNRTLLEDRVEQAIRHAGRQSESFSLIFLDLDRFKPINDYIGHHSGDKLLQKVATQLSGTLRSEDTVARIGGDEFVIMLHNVKDPQKVHEMAQRLQGAISGSFLIDDQPVSISASLGISMYPNDGRTFQALLVNADSAMYHAKSKGPNNIAFFSEEMNANANLRIELENDLRRAIQNDEFTLHYQPKVTFQTGSIESVEALIRWKHPTRGLLSPLQFIPLAEETGLIVPLGTWVIREACRENMAWQKAGLPRFRMAVNLSALQFLRQDLSVIIMEALLETGLDPDCLEIEITESLLMHDPEEAMKTLSEIRSKGVHVAIDDFGTGYSSFSYLKRFPLDKLKIDRSFILEIEKNPNDAAIVRTIITLGHSLNLRVIAEGVETEGQMAILRTMGCDAYQGFYKTRPLPPDQLMELVKKDRKDRIQDKGFAEE